MGDIIDLRKKPKKLHLGDRKENYNKKLEAINKKKKEIKQLINNIKKR